MSKPTVYVSTALVETMEPPDLALFLLAGMTAEQQRQDDGCAFEHEGQPYCILWTLDATGVVYVTPSEAHRMQWKGSESVDLTIVDDCGAMDALAKVMA